MNEKEWETMWEVFPELSTNPGEPATNQQFTPSTNQAIISTTQICTNTTSSHAQPHNSGHLHHTNIPISNNSKKPKKSKKSKNPSPHITIPKRDAPTKVFPATDFRLKGLKNAPLPFQHHKAILQPDHNTNPKSSHTTTTTTTNPSSTQPRNHSANTTKFHQHPLLPCCRLHHHQHRHHHH